MRKDIIKVVDSFLNMTHLHHNFFIVPLLAIDVCK